MPQRFVKGLSDCGVNFRAESVIHKADMNRPLPDDSKILPSLNREAYQFKGDILRFIHSVFIFILSLQSFLANRLSIARGVRLVGELVPRFMEWDNFYDKRLWEILELACARGMVLNFYPKSRVYYMEGVIKRFPRMDISYGRFLKFCNRRKFYQGFIKYFNIGRDKISKKEG